MTMPLLAFIPQLVALAIALLLFRPVVRRYRRLVTKDRYVGTFRKCFLAGDRAKAVKLTHVLCTGSVLGEAVREIARAQSRPILAMALTMQRTKCRLAIMQIGAVDLSMTVYVIAYLFSWLPLLVPGLAPTLPVLAATSLAVTACLLASVWLNQRAIRHVRHVSDELPSLAEAIADQLK